jgi:cysteine desulfurase
MAIKGVAYSLRDKGDHIITSAMEHHAVIHTCKVLEKEGFKVTYLPIDREGLVSLTDLENAFTEKTILVSIIHANNEIGTIQPIREIGALCKKRGIIFHTDAVQSFTKVPIDVKKDNIDLASFSAHKIHGPKGIGALYVRKGVRLKPLFDGGSQERKYRPGTENVPGIVGFAKAVELMKPEHLEHMQTLRDDFISQVLDKIPHTMLNGSKERRLCNNANISFAFVEGEGILMHLDDAGIAVSTGSACSSQSLEPSHVLLALGLKHEECHGSIRFTFGKENIKKEVDYTVQKLEETIRRLRALSPLAQ